jgi:hypothetical protein
MVARECTLDKYQRRLEEALDEAGAKLVRHKKHMVYELANGRMVTVSSTPSDVNSSKKAYYDVRRTAAITATDVELCNGSVPDEPDAELRARHRPPAPNQVIREESQILHFSSGASNQQLRLRPQELQFRSVAELVSVADEVDSFWSLNADGRTRVLMKLAERFADVLVVGTRSYKTTYRGFQWYLHNCDMRDPLLALKAFDWKMQISRSLYVTLPDGQVQIIESASKKVIEGTDQIVVILPKSDTTVDERVDIETIGEEPEPELNHFVFHHFIRIPKMVARDLSFTASEEWVDPRLTRAVVSEMLAGLADHRKTETF